ncbi:MAG: T9SS C-terminal target domain-containing protein, partial [Bacteroidota bacterium]
INHIDVYSSNDDGIEIFGGTVNINYASVAFATDDAFDFDEGYRGNIQFAFVLQLDGDETVYDQAGEWDGAIPDDAALFAAPNIYNATFIGPGQSSTGAQRALIMRDAFAGKLGNSIIEDFPGIGIQVEDIDSNIDSYARLTTAADGFQIEILNNTWAQFGGATDLASLVQATSISDDPDTAEDETFEGESEDVVSELTDNANNYSAASVVTSISRTTDGGLDPRPAAATEATTTVPEGMMQVDYRGAFVPGEATWLSGWSTLSQLGILFE